MILSLAAATAPAESRELMMQNATKAGFNGIGFRFDLDLPDASEIRRLQSSCRMHGLAVLDLEVVRIGDEDPETTKMLFDAAGQLGAKNVVVVSDTDDIGYVIDRFGEICDMALRVQCRASLEFMGFTGIADLATALHVINQVGHEASGLIIDALHVQRCGVTSEDIAGLDKSLVTHLQLCDGPVNGPVSNHDLAYEARHNRLMPGLGEFALARLIADVGPCDTAVEVQNDAYQTAMTPSDLAQHAYNSVAELLSC